MGGGAASRSVEPALEGTPETVRVLHVEDDPVYRRVTRTLLAREDGIVVSSARDAREALERLDHGEYDCVVSDHQMPGPSGLDLLEAVRRRDPGIPFILLTGKGSEEIASQAVSAGVTDYVQKEEGPDQFEVLAHRIRTAVEKRRNEDAARRVRRWYEALLGHAQDFVTVLDGEMTVLYESPSIEGVLGYDPQDRVGKSGLEGVHPEDREAVAAAVRGDGPRRVEYRVRTADGDWLWVESVSTAEPVDEVGGYVTVTRDLGDSRTRRRRLEAAETFLRRDALLLVPGGEGALRLHGLHPGAQDQADLPVDEVRGRTLREALGEEAREEVQDRVRTCTEAGDPVAFEVPAHRGDLPSRWRVTLVPVDGRGAPEVLGLLHPVAAA